MAIVRTFGKPDLFITFTCNPQWPEIQDQLKKPQQTANDRPDLCTRMFRLKLKAMKDDLKKHKVFGRIQGDIHSIEFEKCGLPQAHVLIILHPEDKPRNTMDYDNYVSAEIPHPEADPELFQTITRTNVHGPCGPAFPNSPCMKNGQCSKNYPKQFLPRTSVTEDLYPIYRRRQNGRTFQKRPGGFTYDNRWIVPYNPYLSKKYDAHINVEIVSSVKAVKYLYQYVNKGGGSIHAGLEYSTNSAGQTVATQDESQMQLDGRYLFSFSLHSESPSICPLAIHLDMQRPIYLRNSLDPCDVDCSATTLTQFFEINKTDEVARNTRYQDFPRRFTWNLQTKKWSTRKRGDAIGRIYYVSPRDSERYYLRMLLLNRLGCTSFEDIRTVDGITYDTYQEACIVLDLIRNNEEYNRNMEEVTSGDQLMDLFVLMLLHCEIPDVKLFYEKHKDKLLECASDIDDEQQLLRKLHQVLSENGSSLHEFERLPQILINDEQDAQESNFTSFTTAMETDLRDRIASLTDQQRHIFDTISTAVLNYDVHRDNMFFIDGPGGSGKTYLLQTIIDNVEKHEKIVLIVASSGITSLCLRNGATAHSTFEIPLNAADISTCNISLNSPMGKKLLKTALIVWDEATVHSKLVYQAVERTFSDIKQRAESLFQPKPFGGIPMLFAGDFRQILPVIKQASPLKVVQMALNNCRFWSKVHKFTLSDNMRLQSGNESWAEYLLQVGEGTLPTDEESNITLPPNVTIVQSPQAMITEVFGAELNEEYFASRAIISAKNVNVDEINELVVERMTSASRVYASVDELASDSTDTIPVEYLNTLQFGGLPPHKLTLKIGCVVMCLRSISKKNGIMNGTRIRVTNMHQYIDAD